jgi:uncharacterized membrane protein YfcA
VSVGTHVLLGLFGLFGGIGITALGPGGVLVTIGLFALSGLSPAEIAGTAIVTNVGAGLLGAGVYLRSGQLREPGTRRLARTLIGCAVLGTPLGVLANAHVSGPLFGALLGACVMAVGVLLYVRVRRPGPVSPQLGSLPRVRLMGIGAAVAVVSGLFGLGGPLLSVPLLIAAGAPMLTALAAAQAQSVVIAGVGTIGYAVQGDVSWSLALIVGVPQLAGVVIGWRVAQALPADRLRVALAGALILLGPYLILRNA